MDSIRRRIEAQKTLTFDAFKQHLYDILVAEGVELDEEKWQAIKSTAPLLTGLGVSNTVIQHIMLASEEIGAKGLPTGTLDAPGEVAVSLWYIYEHMPNR